MNIIIQDLKIVPDMKTSKPKLACIFLFFFTHRIKHHLKFFVQYFQQKYMHMQIQYKNNYAKYAAFLIELIVGFFPFGKGDDIILLQCRGGGFISS